MINMDAHEVAVHVNRLEKMHKSALPNAIRGTLNSMAFDVKKNTMPKEAQRAFINRDRNFFKAKSRVKTARGWNVDRMASVVGFVGNSQSVEDLEAQERGGIIKGRAFIPVSQARTGRTINRKVARRNQLRRIKKVVNVSDAKGRTAGDKFVKSAVHVGVGGYLLRGEQLLRVKQMKRNNRSKWTIKTELLYTYRKGRVVRVRPTNFMQRATDVTAKKGNSIFIKEAERQFHRLK